MGDYSWINFEVDVSRLPTKTWIQLGECMSKCTHISQVALKPSLAQKMHEVYLAKGAQATTAIEGNTLSEEQVRQLIHKKLELPPSKNYLKQEVQNILDLCNTIMEKLKRHEKIILTQDLLCQFNKKILEGVPIPEHVIPGEFRSYNVGVGPYKAPESKHVLALTEKMCSWLNESSYFDLGSDFVIISSVIKAVVTHLYIAWIHPFGDGNGRLARILEFAILLASGVPSPAAHLLSNHYNATRAEYYRQLDSASKTNDITSFIGYAVQGLLDGLKEQLAYIFSQNFDICWENYVFEILREHKHTKPTMKRRAKLLLALSRQGKPVAKDKLIILNQATIEAYRTRAPITLGRDLAELEKMGLIVETESGYRAKIENMQFFLPFQV